MYRKDTLFGVLDKFGPFQRRLCLLMCLPLIMKGYQTMMVILIFTVPPHRCRVPGLENDSYAILDDAHMLQVLDNIPAVSGGTGSQQFAQCRRYEAQNHTEGVASSNASLSSVDCDAWVYDHSEFEATLITQFDLVCEKKAYRAHFNLASMIGKLIGCSLASVLCDRIGRKPVFYVSALGCLVFGVLSAFPPSPEVFFVYRLIKVTFGTALFLAVYVLCLEFVGPDKRNLVGSLMMVVWLAGPFLAGLTAYITTNWQHIQLASALPLAFCIAYWWLTPESPRWLLSRGRTDQAETIIRRVAKTNSVDIELVAPHNGETEKPAEIEGLRHAYRLLVKYPNLVVRILIIFFNWIVLNMTYYGLSLNVANLSGSVRVNFLLSCAVELVGYCLAWALLDRLGRKRLHCACMSVAGVAMIATILTVSLGGPDLQWATTALAMVGKMGVSACFSSIYLITSELFPTVIRNSGLGSSSTVGRIGSVVSPYVADLSLFVEGRVGQALPLTVFGGLSLIAAGLSLLLPETLHRKLPETLEDAASFGISDVDPDPANKEVSVNGDCQATDPFVLKDNQHRV